MFCKPFNLIFLLLAHTMGFITFTNALPAGTTSIGHESTDTQASGVEKFGGVFSKDPITGNLTAIYTPISTRTLVGRDLIADHPYLGCAPRLTSGPIPGECVMRIDMTRDNFLNLGVTIFAHDCRQLGDEYVSRRGQHLSVFSELPHTMEITTSAAWLDGSPGWIAAYAGQTYTWWTGRNAGVVWSGDQNYQNQGQYEHWSSALLWFKCSA